MQDGFATEGLRRQEDNKKSGRENVLGGIAMSRVWETLKKALSFRAIEIALRSGRTQSSRCGADLLADRDHEPGPESAAYSGADTSHGGRFRGAQDCLSTCILHARCPCGMCHRGTSCSRGLERFDITAAKKIQNTVQPVFGSSFSHPHDGIDHKALRLALLNEVRRSSGDGTGSLFSVFHDVACFSPLTALI